ncbi:MAG: PspC domain-containing protein, partial [Actinobacteria bacterium]|nr:PspC domain-containing protein [Actinomycetota bacterium]
MTESPRVPPVSVPRAPTPRPPLVRSREQRVLAGVCAGLADHLGYPVAWVRGAMLVFGALGGAGVLFYVWLWVTVPWGGEVLVQPMRRALTAPAHGGSTRVGPGGPAPVATGSAPGGPASAGSVSAPQNAADPTSAQAARPGQGEGAHRTDGSNDESPRPQPTVARTRWPVSELLLGSALLIAGLVLVLVQFGVELDLGVILPTMVVLVGVGLTWWQIADRDRPERNQLPRVLGALGLVAVGVLTFFVTARQPNALTVIAAALAVLAGVSLALAPWLLRINRDLISERAARAREAERSEIAAHLHDSVLQTLAAIQQRSEPGSEVARLARGQERELREWLFRAADGAEPPPRENLEVELRAHAAALEEAHAVRFEVVGVGT